MGLVFKHVTAFLGSILLGLYIVPVMIRAAKKLRFLDVPDGKIKTHKAPVPNLGGLALYITFITILALIYPFGSELLWFILGTTLLLLVGLVDDFNALTPLQKIGGQIVAVSCFLKGGVALKSQFFDTYTNLFASGFWILSVINAFNLVDVMDGLSGVLALVSALSFCIIALILEKYLVSLLLTILIGALIAFLFYNRPPAKIYLGDAGSLFVGGFIAAMPLLFSWTHILHDYRAMPGFAFGNVILEIAISAIVPILIVGIPLLEVALLIIIRKYKGIPFYSGSPHHFAIYLQNKGYSVKQVLFFSIAISSILSSLGLLFMFGIISFLMLCVGVLGLFLAFVLTVFL